ANFPSSRGFIAAVRLISSEESGRSKTRHGISTSRNFSYQFSGAIKKFDHESPAAEKKNRPEKHVRAGDPDLHHQHHGVQENVRVRVGDAVECRGGQDRDADERGPQGVDGPRDQLVPADEEAAQLALQHTVAEADADGDEDENVAEVLHPAVRVVDGPQEVDQDVGGRVLFRRGCVIVCADAVGVAVAEADDVGAREEVQARRGEHSTIHGSTLSRSSGRSGAPHPSGRKDLRRMGAIKRARGV
ncbi:MAG: hypothetical protein BJ554DRAFT_5223, partial [Olpidium bornovanus]